MVKPFNRIQTPVNLCAKSSLLGYWVYIHSYLLKETAERANIVQNVNNHQTDTLIYVRGNPTRLLHCILSLQQRPRSRKNVSERVQQPSGLERHSDIQIVVVGDPGLNSGKGWRTKSKPYCLLQLVMINNHEHIRTVYKQPRRVGLFTSNDSKACRYCKNG